MIDGRRFMMTLADWHHERAHVLKILTLNPVSDKGSRWE
jgi:hypothetical protein